MKYIISGSIIGVAALIGTTGVALAHEGEDHQGPPPPRPGIFQHMESNLEFLFKDEDNDDDATTSVGARIEVEEHGSATSTERNHGKRGDMERSEHASSTHATDSISSPQASSGQAASTTKKHDDDDRGPRGLTFFLRWLFGLPASTTIADIRAEIGATTTASTTIGTSTPQGLGFFARLFSLFHFGTND